MRIESESECICDQATLKKLINTLSNFELKTSLHIRSTKNAFQPSQRLIQII